MIKVAIVEDDIAALNYLSALLGGAPGIRVTGVFATGASALEKIASAVPDVLIVDIGLPDMSGIDVITSVREQHAGMDIIVHTMHEDRKHLVSALKAGAAGYILKGASSLEIINAVESIACGGSPMSPRIARYLVEDFHSDHRMKEPVCLTPREKDVLTGLASGVTEKQLAASLDLSPHTVHSHVKNIYRKLHAKSQAEAVGRAKRARII